MTITIGKRRSAIQRCSYLHANPRGFAHHPAKKTKIELARFICPRANLHRNTRCTQVRKALPPHQWIGIGNGSDHPRNTSP